jgi:hypothetical protein
MKKSSRNVLPLIALMFLLYACEEKVPEENPINKILKIKELSDLATVEYTVTKIIKATDDSTWYKLGDRKMLMSCDAKIKAGVSLSEITDKDIVVNGTAVSLQLPAAKILYINIPPESVVEQYAEIDLLRAEFSIAEKNAFLQVAEKDVNNTVKELDILATAEKNTKTIIESWLSIAGFKNIAISFKK